MIENPSNGRVVIHQEYNSLSIEIPAKKHWAQILFFMIWLGGWAVGEYFALNTLLSSNAPLVANAFIIFWLIGWTFGGGIAFYTILWQLFGREIIIAKSGQLAIQRTVFGFEGKRRFETGSITNMQIVPDHAVGIPDSNNKKGLGRQGGKIRFDNETKSIRFGMDIGDREAKMIIDRLRQSGYLRSENFISENDKLY